VVEKAVYVGGGKLNINQYGLCMGLKRLLWLVVLDFLSRSAEFYFAAKEIEMK